MEQLSFVDHDGYSIPYVIERTRITPEQWTCSIDPHLCGEFTVMGYGRSKNEALQDAKNEWRAFDEAQ